MCDECGSDHPTFDDVAADVVFLDRAFLIVEEMESKRVQNGYSISSNTFSVDYFARRVAENITTQFMNERVMAGVDPVRATERLAAVCLLAGFQIALLTRSHWLAENPETYATEAEYPSEEEVSAWRAEQEAKLEELRKVPTQEEILAALKDAGINLPDHVVVMGIDDGNEPKQTGEDGSATGLYL